MSFKKTKARFNQLEPQPQLQHQPSDYDTDANVLIDLPPPPPTRSNEELNLAVIRRHDPAVTSILSIAPYAVVYLFSPTSQQWEKCGVEGTLFVCQLTPSPIGSERFSVIILNRRGLDNFMTDLSSGDDVETTEEYVILQVNDEGEAPQIYGLWIFSEPPPSSTAETRAVNARIIQDCAVRAEASRRLAEQRQREAAVVTAYIEKDGVDDEVAESVPMGRQLSLRELFGQQREQDAGWSVHNHHNHARPPAHTTQFSTTPDMDFFKSTQRLKSLNAVKPQPSSSTQQPTQSNVLLDLFKQAKQGYQGNG